MGFFKKVFRPVRKIAKKIIPKEVRPFLPYVAAAFGPATAGLTGTAFAKAAAQKALMAAATSAATDEQGDPLRAGLLAITPDVIGAGATKLGSGDGRIAEFLNKTKTLKDGTETMSLVERAQALQSPETFGDFAKVTGAQTAIDQSAKFAEIRQDELDEYNRSLREQGVLDKTKRRTAIFNIYKNAGYEDDYVNSMLDRYGYASGGEVEEEMSEVSLSPGKGRMTEIEKTLYAMEEGGDKGIMSAKRKKRKKDDDDSKNDLAGGLMAAADGVQKAFGRSFGNMEPVPMLRFARGGEVEIEEETEDLGIMDFMKDQGVPFGEMASDINNERVLEQLFEEFLDMGLSPEDAAKAAREAFDRMSSKPRDGIMQMASGYKTDIEEMYEQYVFEMEEMGLEPMSFSQFLARERAGMADGGEVSIGQIEMLIKRGADNDLIKEYTGAADGVIDQIREAMKKKQNKKDGGKVKRRKKGEPMDDDGKKPGPSLFPKVPKGEFFLDKMPKPKRRDGILEAADGGIMEKDMRGGGFIPEGSKERADDVPARLSKNEFVMTADAVRAAGGGSVNKGAKRMYDMMYSLEGKI